MGAQHFQAVKSQAANREIESPGKVLYLSNQNIPYPYPFFGCGILFFGKNICTQVCFRCREPVIQKTREEH
jgi:hypothetical protein